MDSNALIKRAIKLGELQAVQVLYSSTNTATRATLCLIAAHYGKVKCLKFLHMSGSPIKGALSAATKHGMIGCVRYLLRYDKPTDEDVYNAAIGGRTRILLEFYKYIDFKITPIMPGAAITELVKLGAEWDTIAIKNEAIRGDLKSIRKSLRYGRIDAEVFIHCMQLAAIHGHKEILTLLSSRYKITPLVVACGAINSPQMLQHIRSLGGEWDHLTISACIDSRNIKSLEFAIMGGCPIGLRAVQYVKKYPEDELSIIIKTSL